MEYRKNDIVTLDIEDCGVDGEGIGKADGFTVFVKDAVIGDRVTAKIMKAKKNYGYGRLMEILKPSPYRAEPKCAFARQCGGCQLQALSYEQQLAFKEKKVRGHLERIGGFTELPMEPIIGMDEPYHYRNKAQFPVGKNKEGRIITGFYAGRTHTIIENRDCALGVSQNKEVLDRVIAHMEAYGIEPYNEETGKGLVRHILIRYGFFTGEVMVCLVLNGSSIPQKETLIEHLLEIPGMTSITINVNKKRSNVILGEEIRLLWGKPYITDRRYFLPDFSAFLFPGQPASDRKALQQSFGVRRPSRRGNSMGPLLRHRNNFSFSCPEGKVCPRCGNYSGSH